MGLGQASDRLLLAAMAAFVAWSAGLRVITADHFQYLLPVRRQADPDFARGDWFVDETTPFHYTFQGLLGLAEQVGVTTGALVVLHLLILALLFAAVRRLCETLGGGLPAAVLAVVVIRFGVQFTWGSVNLLGTTALPHYAGLACALFTISELIAGRAQTAIGLAVLTAYVHVSVGAWLILVLGIVVLVDALQRRQFVSTARQLAPAIVVAAVALVPLALLVSSGFTGGDVDGSVFEILFRLRAPHHYDFGEFGWENHRDMAVVASVALLAEHRLSPPHRGIRTVVGSILLVGLLGWFFLDVVYWPLPVRLFPYRIAPIITGLAAVAAASLACRSTSSRVDRVWGIVGVAALLVAESGLWIPRAIRSFATPVTVGASALGLVGAVLVHRMLSHQTARQLFGRAAAVGLGALAILMTFAPSSSQPRLGWLVGALVGLSVAFVGLELVESGRAPRSPESSRVSLAPLLPVAVLPLVLVATFVTPPVHTDRWLTDDQQALADVISTNVPVGGALLVPPNQAYVRMATSRAIVVDFKVFPLAGAEMREWRSRLADLRGSEIPLDGLGGWDLRASLMRDYSARPLADLVETAERYDADFVVVGAASVAASEISDSSQRHWEAGGFILVEATK